MMRSRLVRVAAAIAASVVMSSTAHAAPPSGGAVGDPVDGGAVVVVKAAEQDRPIIDGTGSTAFTLRLPTGASCPGDSAHDDWRIQTFIVPVGDDPGELTYDLIAPKGDGRYALYGVDTDPYMQQLTLPNPEPGGSGLIPAIEPLSFAIFPPGTLPAGRYRIGVACTYFRETAIFWDTQIDVTDDSSDLPAQLAWRVVDTSAVVPTSGTGQGSSTMLAIGAAVVVIGGLLMFRRRLVPSRSSTTTKETS
jgi:LPXTG-motif cell wall-anchored protein